ncbi:hypothetical protein DFO55_11855 [Grimontella sp. AG753]|nr:hypothetical protein DFO55_11855 [Grimontella sp. AG753]
MQLVRKKNPTGGSIRWLRPEEEDAIKAYCSSREPLSTGELALAGSVLQEMRQKEAWLECDCVRGEHPARNSANLMKDTAYRNVQDAYRIALKSLARRYIELHDEMADLDIMITSIVD